MLYAEVFRVALGALRANKLRSLLTMLGIVIGVGAVIIMVAIGNGAQSQIEKQIGNLGTNMIVITAGSTAQGGETRVTTSCHNLSAIGCAQAARGASHGAVTCTGVMTTSCQESGLRSPQSFATLSFSVTSGFGRK